MADTEKAAKIAELEARLSKVRRVKELESRLAEIQAKKETLPETAPVDKPGVPEKDYPGFFANFIKGAKQGLSKDIPRQASVLSKLASGKAKDEAPIPVEQSAPFKIMSPSTWSRKGAGQFLGRGLASSVPTMGATLGGATAGAAAGSVIPGIGTVIGGLAGAAIGAGATAGAQTLADFYNEARTTGATHEEALEAAKSAGYTSGAINALAAPLGAVGLSKTLAQPGIKSLAGYAGKQAAIQGAAGGVDVAAQNTIAQGSFAPKREITEGIPEAMVAGAAFQGLPIAVAAPKMARHWAGKTALEMQAEPMRAAHEPIAESIRPPVPEAPKANIYDEISMLENAKKNMFDSYKKTEAELEALKGSHKEEEGYDRYHGTSHELDISDLSNAMEGPNFTANNLFGPGFYTTDNLSIAKGYSKKGKGEKRNIYSMKEKREPKLIDLQKPIGEYPELKKLLEEHSKEGRHELDDALAGVDLDKLTGEEYFDRLQDLADNEGMPAHEYQEYIDWNLVQPLMDSGYDGLTHVGGKRTGNDPHKVNIYWDPKSLLDVKKHTDPIGELTARLEMQRERLNSTSKMLRERQDSIGGKPPKGPEKPPEPPGPSGPIEPVDTKHLGEKIFGVAEKEKASLVSKAKEKVSEFMERPGLQTETALFDSLAPVKHAGIEGEGYRLERENLPFRAAKAAQHITGIVEASLLHGTPEWNSEQVGFQQKPNSKGMLQILEPALKDKHSKDAFATYAYARRVKTQELVAKGKEKNISASEAENAIRQLEAEYPEFKETFNELQDYNKSLLDAAEATGIINEEGRKVWAQEDYTPFFRKEQAEKGKLLGGKKKLAGQKSPIKKLTGGSEKYAVFDNGEYKGRYDTEAEARDVAGDKGQIYPVGPETADMYENLATNATRLIERSQRNGAALSILEHAEKAGIAEPTTYEGERPKDVVQVMKDGKDTHYKITDPLLYEALEGTLNPKQAGVPFLNAFEWTKNLISRSIMSTPKVMFNVAVKDAIFSRAMGKEPMVPLTQSVKDFGEGLSHQFKGEKDKTKASQDVIDMMFMGNDTTFYQNKPKDFVNKILERVDKDAGKHNATVLSAALSVANPKKWFATLEKFGRAAELSTRIGKYRAAKKAGANKFEAGFESMDYLNYANRGSSGLVQMIGQTVPFFNAHMAGIHKLGRELAYNDPKMKFFRNRTIKAGSVIAAFSMANMLNNLREDDNEEDAANNYLSLPNYVRNNNIVIDLYKLPGMEKEAVKASNLPRFFLIPKPWEIGQLFSSIPEQFIMQAHGDKDWKDSIDYLIDAGAGTLSVNPLGNPIVKTGLEQYMNKKFFTGQPIVPRSREGLEPELQSSPFTSSTAKAAGKATGISPDRIEHAASGLIGPAYLWPVAVTDLIIDTFSVNKKPEKKTSEYPFLSTFTKETPQRSAYQEELYEMSKEADKAYTSLKTYHKLGEDEKAEKYMEKKGTLLESRGLLNKMKKEIKGFEDEINHIRDDGSLSAKDKRTQIDELTKQKNNLLYNFKQIKKEIKP